MKNISKRFWVLLVIIALFLGCLGYFAVQFVGSAETWVSFPGNGHLFKNGALKNSGAIYDRAENVLVKNTAGTRTYNPNEDIRRATLHVVGDKEGFIATGAQSIFSSKLTNYNIFTGVYGLSGEAKGTESADVYLTIDSDIEKAASKALGNRKGAVAVYNYKTGEILCMVSSPTFDPQNKPKIDEKDKKWDGVYLNRATSGTFTPGSIFKIITSAAAIDNIPNIFDKEYECKGEMQIGPDKITCPNAHGKLGFQKAMTVSCNVTYAQIALELGSDKLQKEADNFYYNKKIKYGTQTFAKSVADIKSASNASLAWAGIGQYTDVQNPAHMMLICGAIANGGSAREPYLLSKTVKNGVEQRTPQTGYLKMTSDKTAKSLAEMMRYNVLHNYGESRFGGLKVGAKSGTAEVGGGSDNNHAWFAGFVQDESCPIAFSVVVENGGAGSSVAGDVAGKVVTAAKKVVL